MKRALSLLLCVAMLMSMAVIGTSAEDGPVWDASLVPEDKRNTEITFTLDKESYKPGDVVAITATIDSMWGDLSIEGRMPGYDAGMDLPGMYGVGCLQTCLIFDPSVFKMSKAITSYAKETITNGDVSEVAVTTPILANQLWTAGYGYLSVMMQAGSDNSEGTGYAALGGSGKFFTAYLKIADDALPGSYDIIPGAYTRADNDTPGFETTDVFFGAEYARMDNCFNYNTESIDVKYNMPPIVVAADVTEEDIAAAAAVDALITKIPEDVTVPVVGGSAVHVADIDNQYSEVYNEDGKFLVAPGSYFQFDFMIESKTNTGNEISNIGGASKNNKWMGYDLDRKALIIADAGAFDGPNDSNIYASYPVDIPAGEWHTVRFAWTNDGAAIYFDGEKVLENACGAASGYYIFYPKNATYFMDNVVVGNADKVLETVGAFSAPNTTYWKNTSVAYTVTNVTPVYADVAIVAAEEAYAALTPVQQTLVVNAAKMTTARATFDAAQAAAVDALIDAIGNCFVVNPETEAQIVKAEAAYAALTPAQKALVTKYDILVQNRTDYDDSVAWDNAQKAQAVDDVIASIGVVTFESRETIERAEAMYAALTETQKALVTKYDVLVAARAEFDRYLPVMNVENLIGQIPTIPAIFGKVYHKNCDNISGYMNYPQPDGSNCTWDFETSFDFYYTSYDASQRAVIGGLRAVAKSEFVGYNLNTKAFEMGGAHWIAGGDPTVYASKPYDLKPNTKYNMGIKWAGSTATITLDGEEMLSYDFANGGGTDHAFFIFLPTYVDLYMANLTVKDARNNLKAPEVMLAEAGYETFVQDITTPNDIEAPLAAAEDAYAALSEEDKALVHNYADLVAIRAAVDAANEQFAIDAANVVALINAIATEDDIAAAQNAYNALLPGAKALVTNYEDLVNARVNIVKGLIAAIGEVMTTSGDAIATAEAKYAALTDDQKALVDNYDVLTAARTEYNAITAAVALAVKKINDIGDVVIGSDPTVFGGKVMYMSSAAASGYAQIGPHDPYPQGKAWGYEVAIYPTALTDPSNSYYGGSHENNQWACYDFTRKAFVIAEAGPWSYNSSVAALATYPVDLALNEWHTIGFFYEADGTVKCTLNGEVVLTYKFASANKGWYISFPRNIDAYLDNFKCWYEGKLVSDVADLTKTASPYYFAMDDNGYSNTTVDKYAADSANLIADAQAAYDAVPDKAKAAVTNYDVLVAAVAKYNSTEISGVTASAEDGMITVNWNAVKNADIYYIYCDGKVVGSVWSYLTTSYTFAAAPGEHNVSVGIYVNGAIGAASAPVAVVVPEKVLPTASATATYNSITLTWDAVDGAAYYYVKTTVAGSAYIAKVVGTSYTVNYLAADTEYTINIEAVRGYVGNKVDKIDFVPVVATTASAPALTVTVDGANYTVEWDAFDDVTLYYVKATIGSYNYIIPVYGSAAATISRTLTAVAGADYTVTVQAYHSPRTLDNGVTIYSVYSYAPATNA